MTAIYMASSGMSPLEAALLMVVFAFVLGCALYTDLTKGQK